MQESKNILVKDYKKVLAVGLAFFISAVQFSLAQDGPMATDVYYKALAYYQKGKWDAAREYFHTYLAEYSDSPLYITSLYYLGVCYQRINNQREAMSIFHKVMDEARSNDDMFWAKMAERRVEELVANSPD